MNPPELNFVLTVHEDEPSDVSPTAQICSVLVDLVEACDWRALQDWNGPEPDIIQDAPVFLPALIYEMGLQGYTSIVKVGQEGDIVMIREETAITSMNDLLNPQDQTRAGHSCPIYVWSYTPDGEDLARVAASDTHQGGSDDAFISTGGVVITLVRSATSIFVASRSLPLVLEVLRRVFVEISIPVRWRSGYGGTADPPPVN